MGIIIAAAAIFGGIAVFGIVEHDHLQSRCARQGQVLLIDGRTTSCIDAKGVLHPIPRD